MHGHLQLAQDLNPAECLLLDDGRGALEPLADEVVHVVLLEGRHVRVEELAEQALELGREHGPLGHVVYDGVHPEGHGVVPHLVGDDLVRDQVAELGEFLSDLDRCA